MGYYGWNYLGDPKPLLTGLVISQRLMRGHMKVVGLCDGGSSSVDGIQMEASIPAFLDLT